MNNQEAFDIAGVHLLKQGRRSVDVNGVCLYRDAGGCKCAIGALIPDELYSEALEGMGVFGLVVEGSDNEAIAALFKGVDIELLAKLQCTHDSEFRSPRLWKTGLRDIAKAFGLDFSRIEKIPYPTKPRK